MALRMTGMMSGLDTESIIQELVSARRTKVDKQKKAQTKLNWKQDAWKDLNKKLKNLQTKYLSTMRFADAYSKKVTKVSNSSAVSVITGQNAVNGVQSLEIKELAKTGYLTGAVIKKDGGGELTALSKLSEIIGGSFTGEGTINVKAGDKSVDIKVTADTTISDVLTQLKDAGLNASFDAKWQRFSVSSKESGAANNFTLTAGDANGAAAIAALGLQTDIKTDSATMAEYKEYAEYFVDGDRAATIANMRDLIDRDIASRKDAYLNRYTELVSSSEAAQKKIDDINSEYAGSTLMSADEYKTELEAKNAEIKTQEEELEKITDPDAKRIAEENLLELKKEAADIEAKKADAETLAAQQENLSKYTAEMQDIESYISVTKEDDGTYSAQATGKLTGEVEDRYYNKASYAYDVVNNNVSIVSSGATKISGQDAVIHLNGAEYKNSSNTFEINGLTFTALNTTKDGEVITVTTEQDTDGVYDMVKNFLKEYNAIVNEMDKLYNADSAKGYEPLTSEEKEALSESEVKEWEDKVKAALLRRDDNLSTVNSAMQSIMAEGVTVNGKTMHLYDFGIDMLGYFNAPDNEKHAYHIDGDPDDGDTMNNPDKLKTMISNDPDTVISFFSQLSRNLYDKMTDLSKSVDGYRSFGSFYDDKKMKSDYDDYTSKIKDLEAKLADYEDKWYAKFSKMETALAKMQSNANAVTSLLGGG